MAQTPAELMAIRAEFANALDEHDLDKIVSFFTEDGVFDLVPEPAPFVGREQIRAAFEGQFTHSPDWHTDEGRVMAAENIVTVEHSALGTNTGPLLDPSLPITGKAWMFPHLDIYEFEGDKIKRLTSYGDMAGVYIQLGLIPAPEIPELTPTITVPDHEPTGLSAMEANAEHVKRWNSRDAALMAKIYHTDCKLFAGPLGAVVDRMAMTALNEMYFSAFSNVNLEAIRVIELGDGWVLTELASHATHQGPFMSTPPLGYPTEIRLVWLMHYSDDGLLIEGSFYYDNVTLTNQMTTPPEYMPDGTWVVMVPTEAGNITFLHTVSPQGKMGGPFAGVLLQVNSNPTFFGMFPEADRNTNWITKNVWKGRNRVESTMLTYGTKKGEGPLMETVYIGIVHAEWTLTGPNTNEGKAIEAIYLAEQDADGDGFPDPGEQPIACPEFAFTSKRLTMMPPCVPMP